MNRPPPWLLRSGTGLLLAGVTVLFALGWFIHYPDMITAKITLTGTTPVTEVVARQNGHLASLRVREKQLVKRDDILAIIRNPADAEAVLALAAGLDRLAPALAGDKEITASEIPVCRAPLGTLQNSWAAFNTAWTALHALASDDYATRTAALLENQIALKKAQISGLETQAKLTEREHSLENDQFERMKELHRRSSISTVEYEEAERKFIAAGRLLEAARRSLTEERIALTALEKELSSVSHTRREELREAREKFRGTATALRSQIDLWQADFVLRAPAEGTVAFHDFWSDQQYVTAGQAVFLIVPETTRLVGRMNVSQEGSGKISRGQSVRIKLHDFPYKEFGIVSAHVESVSAVARESANLVLVDLEYPLTTSYGRSIPFKQEMAGEANIITEDMRLIGRVFNEVRKAFVHSE